MATVGLYHMERNRDKTFDFLCVVCKGKNINTEADLFCIECHDYYCSSCVNCHDDIPALKHHQILDKSTTPLPAVPTERCKEHKDKPVDMYCKNHNAVGCSVCMLMKHSSCKDKLYIPDFIKINIQATNSINIEEHLESIAKSLNMLQKAIIKEKEKLKGNKDKVLKEIGTFREIVNQLLDIFERNTIKQLEQSFKPHSDDIDSILRKLQDTTTEIKAAQDSLKSAGGNMPQKFVSIMQANQVVSEAKEIVVTSNIQVSPPDVYFLANKKLQTLFSDIQDLGSIKEKLRITGREKYPINVKSDSKTCYIISACTPNDDTIILADNFNRKLKRIDSSSYTVIDCCEVPGQPWQVCAITDAEVAVCFYMSQLIQYVNVGRTMKKNRNIKTGFECRGLAFANEKLFVSGQSSVSVFSLSGEQLQQLYNDQPVQGLFSAIRTLAINYDVSRIYVADSAKGLIVLDTNGLLVRQYNEDKLRGASGVCLDKNDNVLVCSGGNVLQFSPDGKLISEVLKTDGTCTCIAVCCNRNNAKLIVAFWQKNEIEVYDINAE